MPTRAAPTSGKNVNNHAPVGSSASICRLCRFYLTYSKSRYWSPLCSIWNRALQVRIRYTWHMRRRSDRKAR